MKTASIAALTLLLVASHSFGEITPDDILKAMDEMTPQQVSDMYTKLSSTYWKPIPEGFFTRLGTRIDFTATRIDDVGTAPFQLQDQKLKIDDTSGVEVSLLWKVVAPEYSIGLRFGAQGARESTANDAGYSRINFLTASGALIANAQLLRHKHAFVWVESGIGAGVASMETLNTPTGGASTVREFEGTFGMIDARFGAGWRFNPILSLHAFAGYRFAESLRLEEGGRKTDIRVDPSGFSAGIGLGISL